MLQIYSQMETKLQPILDESFNCKLSILKMGYIGFCLYPLQTHASSTCHFSIVLSSSNVVIPSVSFIFSFKKI
jgi:hypothetical protein